MLFCVHRNGLLPTQKVQASVMVWGVLVPTARITCTPVRAQLMLESTQEEYIQVYFKAAQLGGGSVGTRLATL